MYVVLHKLTWVAPTEEVSPSAVTRVSDAPATIDLNVNDSDMGVLSMVAALFCEIWTTFPSGKLTVVGLAAVNV